MMNSWYGIDLQWAYSDLLRQIYRKTVCQQNALDVLHNALIRFALAKNPDRLPGVPLHNLNATVSYASDA